MVSNIEIDVLRTDIQLLEDVEDSPRRQYCVNWVGLLRIAAARRRKRCSALGRARTTRQLPVTRRALYDNVAEHRGFIVYTHELWKSISRVERLNRKWQVDLLGIERAL
jgi:hypothetical protein